MPRDTSIQSVLIIGSGPIIIGQALIAIPAIAIAVYLALLATLLVTLHIRRVRMLQLTPWLWINCAIYWTLIIILL